MILLVFTILGCLLRFCKKALMSMNVNGSTQQTGTEWFQNMKMQKPDRNAPETQPPQADSIHGCKQEAAGYRCAAETDSAGTGVEGCL